MSTAGLPTDERRAQILAVAALLFAREGYHGASMASLAQLVGVSKAGLYHHFPTKEAILAELLVGYAEGLAAEVEEIADGEASAEERLRALVARLVERYEGEADLHRVQLNELARLGTEEQEAVREAERRVVRAMERLVSAIAPGLAPGEVPVAAMSIFGILNWHPTWFKEGELQGSEGRLARKEYATWVADFVVGGLRALDAARRGGGDGGGGT